MRVWTQCGVSGMLLDVTVNIGKELYTSIKREYWKIEAIALKLVKLLLSNLYHKAYMVNLFWSFNLLNTLKQLEIWTVARICNNCFYGAELWQISLVNKKWNMIHQYNKYMGGVDFCLISIWGQKKVLFRRCNRKCLTTINETLYIPPCSL